MTLLAKPKKNNLIILSTKFIMLKSKLLRDGYTGDILENHILDAISDEILHELNIKENCDDIKRALTNMYFLGAVTNNMPI